ncbi:UDP-galactopyranose mutase [Succiniclasticum ruminis]|uniref:UDP-galactopyranose mutase n=1 Tax=Succiniclasticum ruminis DSM 9236 TaxID=1123323 RepID=A0A1I2AAB9_9FIRM|nr:UDP-galactopyranose mutase [Succiniclasticum ruminis]SFE40901.1 UDP-galactopyranose mutase [Succiniclasticum ruminis DSM 9236]
MYDYLIVGSGLFGSVFAHEMKARGKSVLVIERRDHVGGNIHCEEKEGINIHQYGAHIFHTDYKNVWEYVNRFVEFNNYVNSPVANYHGELYNLPFNMNTFSKMWGVITPKEAAEKIAQQRKVITGEPKNLEEQAISLIGTDVYTKLIKGYTEKQWGRTCTELPAFIIKRLPVRYTFDNNYFNDRFQGIPMGGYNKLIDALLEGIEVRTGVDYNEQREVYRDSARTVIYTGPIDAYFGYRLGQLEYRGLRFETERLEEENHQGVAVMNFTAREVPYTRSIEHKHFEYGKQPVTYVTKEYPAEWRPGEEAYYPVNNDKNQLLYEKYASLAKKEKNVIFGGRLAEYKYYDMDDVIYSALQCVEKELAKTK